MQHYFLYISASLSASALRLSALLLSALLCVNIYNFVRCLSAALALVAAFITFFFAFFFRLRLASFLSKKTYCDI